MASKSNTHWVLTHAEKLRSVRDGEYRYQDMDISYSRENRVMFIFLFHHRLVHDNEFLNNFFIFLRLRPALYSTKPTWT